MKYSYTLEDVNGAGQMFDVLQNGNKRFRIFKSNLKEVFKASINPNSESSMSSNLPDFLRLFLRGQQKAEEN